MDRLLNEKDVIDAIENAFAMSTNNVEKNTAVYGLLNGFSGICKAMIKRLPSAKPQEHKTGEWIQDRSGAYCCSNCMEPCATYAMMKPRDRFCKMCGSRNEVTE